MKISLKWVGDFVDLSDVSPERIAELLSLHTAEVEGLEWSGEAITDVVVGHVVECGRHPDADKLSVTRVEFGGGDPVQVVCGAPNVRTGLKVAFAPVGSTLPGGLKLKKAKLRGQSSHGMICSSRELDLGDDHAGILELPDEASVGERLVDFLDLLDPVLELDNKSLTHRPDLWGHYGFARELAALLDRELKPLPVLESWSGAPANVPITLDDPEGCPLYLGLQVALGGRPGTSPAWLQNRLRAVGQRPLNDVVDLTNYVLLELGQPTHAFDLAKLAGPEIRVRRAAPGETLTTLDEVERPLAETDLVIGDASASVALAGVMGGASSEVSDETETILLESAVFHPVSVRRTSQRLALRTEASSRFEKSLDPAYAELALRRFAHLLGAVRPDAQVLGAPARAGAAAAPEIQLSLDPARTCELLGLDLETSEIAGRLRSIGFAVDEHEASLDVTVPTWRATKDVTVEVDLVEEVGRLAGFHRIEPQPLQAPVEPPWSDPMRGMTRRLGARLAGAHHAYETQAYSFLDRIWAERLGLPIDAFVPVSNPVQDGVDIMRRDPVPSLLEQMAANRREHATGRLFEFAKGYEPRGESFPEQRRWLGVVTWARGEEAADGPSSVFGAAKAIVEDLLQLTGVRARATGEVDRTLAPWAHPARALSWTSGEQHVGFSGCVDPRLLGELELEGGACAVVLLDLAVLAELAAGRVARFAPPSRFPAIKVDVALALPEGVPYGDVEAALRKAGGKLLEGLELFDVFTGGTLEDGQRSLAFHAVLRAPDRTLADKDEQKFLKRVAHAATELGGQLRQ